MSETCYVVATLDTRTLKIIDVGFYSAEAVSLTVVDMNTCHLDVCRRGGRDYHDALKNTLEHFCRIPLHAYLGWVRPWAMAARARMEEHMRNPIVVTGKRVK
jgi:hypothetical protein